MFFNWFNGVLSGTMSYLMYLASQQVAKGGDFEEWFDKDDRSLEEKLVTGAISRTGAFGIVPMMLDTALDVTGNDPWFNNRGSGLASSLFSWEGSPMMQTIGSLGSTGSKLTQGAFQGDLEWQKEDTLRSAKLISNHFAYIGLMEAFSEAYE